MYGFFDVWLCVGCVWLWWLLLWWLLLWWCLVMVVLESLVIAAAEKDLLVMIPVDDLVARFAASADRRLQLA